jgi:multisubunit Na+/H+ antiporter MnhG subunit
MEFPEFHPKFPSFRVQRATAAVFFAVIGLTRLYTATHAGNTHSHGWCLLAIAAALFLGVLPEFPAKQKPQPEKYRLTK